jgi:hypothetical protein
MIFDIPWLSEGIFGSDILGENNNVLRYESE